MGQCLFDCGEGENKTLEMIYFALSVKQITTVRVERNGIMQGL